MQSGEPMNKSGRWFVAGVVFCVLLLAGAAVWLALQSAKPAQPIVANKNAPTVASGKWYESVKIKTKLPELVGMAVMNDSDFSVFGGGMILSYNTSGKDAGSSFSTYREVVAVSNGHSLMKQIIATRSKIGGPGGMPIPGNRAYITSLAFGVDGKSYWVADAGQRVIWHFKDGKVINKIGEADAAKKAPGILMPSPHLDVVPLPDGNIMITNPGRQRVETYAHDGKFLGSWGKQGTGPGQFAGCCNPTDISRFPDGRIVTSEKGIRRVSVYSAKGELDSVVVEGAPLTPGGGAFDVIAMGDGSILVLDTKAQLVRVFKERK